MAFLQPALVFKDEAVRLNTLYWTSLFSYKKTTEVLRLISSTGSKIPDPRVCEIWNDTEVGDAARVTHKLSEFIGFFESNSAELRSISILKICSAFENALSGYFALCSLYEPNKDLASYAGKKIPDLLKKPTEFDDRKKQIRDRCGEVLKGKYTTRINLICKRWGLKKITGAHINRLNGYYSLRHLIAHDQSLTGADSPENSSGEIISTRIKIDEATWKRLLSDFTLALNEIDEEVSSKVVVDGGLHLAIYRIIRRDGAQELADLHTKLASEWRLGNPKGTKTKEAARQIGLTVKQVDGNRYRII